MSAAQPRGTAAIKRYRTARLARLITRAYYLHKRGRDDYMSHIVCEEFMQLGGVYIKFLQGVMLRSYIMRRWQNPDRLRIFENLDSEPIDVVALLRHELGPEVLKKIGSIQPQPFAAGSFGQVYYGQLANGTPIIVKVLRPMIRELLRYDLRLISVFNKRFFSKLYPNMDLNINEALREFSNATLRETDYVAEANFARELYEHYKDHKEFIIPETYLDLCTKNIIVQEYVDGMSVAQLIKLQAQGVDPKTYVAEHLGSDLDTQLELLGYECIKGIFDLPRVQGDPHPGNVKLLSGNRVGLIDFGISAASPHNKAPLFGLLEEWNKLFDNKQSMVRLFEQFMRFFVSDLYRALKKLSSLHHTPEKDADFTQEVSQVAQETFSRVLGERDIMPLLHDGRILQIINEMVNKDNRFGLVMKLEASEILRAAQTYITLVESLGRRAQVLPKVFTKVVNYVEQVHPEMAHQVDDTMSVADALETVSNWLERVAERDPSLFQQLMTRIRIGNRPIEVKEVPSDA